MSKRVVKTYRSDREGQLPFVEVKAVGDAGVVEAVVSIFGNVDLQGDRVVKGAFTKSIEKWRKSGDPVPVIFSHDWQNPMAHIGIATPSDIEETETGLLVKYQLDIETNPVARQVFSLLKRRSVKEHSFAYDILEEHSAKDGANELTQLDLIEIGPTLKGANPDTVLLGVKSALDAAAKAGRVLSAKNEGAIRQAHELIGGVLSQLEAAAAEEGKSRKNVYTYLPGSDEEAREEINVAVQTWAEAKYPAGPEGYTTWAYVVGTFSDHVVVEVTARDAETTYFEIPYTRTTDGTVTLGDPKPVEIVASVAPSTEAAKATEAEGTKGTVDDSAWDGAAAMQNAADANDPAAAFRAIAFERDDEGDPDTAGHWALPHHKAPGDPPNAKGVAAAEGALNGARGGKPNLKDEAAAASHLEAHRNAIEAEQASAEEEAKAAAAAELKAQLEQFDADRARLTDVK